jgi:hypothetical protein
VGLRSISSVCFVFTGLAVGPRVSVAVGHAEWRCGPTDIRVQVSVSRTAERIWPQHAGRRSVHRNSVRRWRRRRLGLGGPATGPPCACCPPHIYVGVSHPVSFLRVFRILYFVTPLQYFVCRIWQLSSLQCGPLPWVECSPRHFVEHPRPFVSK